MKKLGKICIVGLGLIGGSIGMAVIRRRLALKVYGLVRREESIEEAYRYGVVHTATMDPGEAVSGSEMVIMAVPIGVMEGIAEMIKPFVRKGCVVTDVGSSKRRVVGKLEKIFHPLNPFVGGHPMAGSERRGMSASRPDLFERAVCILTPTGRTDKEAVGRVSELWENLGSRVSLLSPGSHDRIIAAVSHLPHVMAVALMNYLGSRRKDVLRYSGSGLRDLTRIAAASPDLWADICMSNKDELSMILEGYITYLSGLREVLEKGDCGKLRRALVRAKELRDRI